MAKNKKLRIIYRLSPPALKGGWNIKEAKLLRGGFSHESCTPGMKAGKPTSGATEIKICDCMSKTTPLRIKNSSVSQNNLWCVYVVTVLTFNCSIMSLVTCTLHWAVIRLSSSPTVCLCTQVWPVSEVRNKWSQWESRWIMNPTVGYGFYRRPGLQPNTQRATMLVYSVVRFILFNVL